MSDDHHRDELVVCANCNARSRSGYLVADGDCSGFHLGTHDWVQVGQFECSEPATLTPQVNELDSAVTGDHVVRFMFPDILEDATLHLFIWGDASEWNAPDEDVTELVIPASAVERLVRSPERQRHAIDVGGTELSVSASLRHDGNPARAAEKIGETA